MKQRRKKNEKQGSQSNLRGFTMIYEILGMLALSYIVYICIKPRPDPKEAPRNINVNLTYAVSDDGDLDSPDISVR